MICIVFYLALGIIAIKYIINKIFFIRPMRKKYDIMLFSEKTSKLNILLICCILLYIAYIFGILYICIYYCNKVLFFITMMIYVIIAIYYYIKYKKYDILEYINWYSEDLFDWDKIYKLDLDENLKRQCFAIHNKNYDNYKFNIQKTKN